jgi:hypothetical protein
MILITEQELFNSFFYRFTLLLFFIFFSEWCMETSGSITDFNNREKAELNEKLRQT